MLHKKDWECLFIPFDAHLQIDKLNAKSPLRGILEEVCEELSLSPVYIELLDIWEELSDEVQFSNHKIDKYGLGLQLKPFELEYLNAYLSFTTKKQMMTPVEYKKLLLNLFNDKVMEKKRLVIIELPELYAEDFQFKEFISIMDQLSSKGIHFIIVTQREVTGNCNYVFGEKILNEACIENLKRKILSEVPFICENELFEKAKQQLLQAVDNSIFNGEKQVLSRQHNEATVVLLFLMIHHLNIRIDLETKGIFSSLDKFIKSY